MVSFCAACCACDAGLALPECTAINGGRRPNTALLPLSHTTCWAPLDRMTAASRDIHGTAALKEPNRHDLTSKHEVPLKENFMSENYKLLLEASCRCFAQVCF